MPSGDQVAPNLESIAADIEADSETIPVADLTDAPEDYFLANQSEATETPGQ